MANRVTGIQIERDVVRCVTLQVAFRSFTIMDAFEERVERELPGDGTRGTNGDTDPSEQSDEPLASTDAEAGEEESTTAAPLLDSFTLDALRRMRQRGAFATDAIYSAIDLSNTYLAQVSLPFAQRAQIEEVLAFQLDGRLPAEVDELHIDFMVGGTKPDGTHMVHAAALAPEVVEQFLDQLASVGIDPAIVDVEPGPLVTATHYALGVSDEVVATVEIGRTDTSIVVLRGGKVELMRSMRVGYQSLVGALSDAFAIAEEAALEGLHREGSFDAQLAIAGGASSDDAWRVADLLRAAARPLLREIRSSLLAHGSATARPAQRVLLCGDVANLPGFAGFLTSALGVTVEPLVLERPEVAAGPTEIAEQSARWANVLGVALRGASWIEGSTFNLRKGEFSFRGSLEFLIGRLPSLGLIALAVLCATGVMLLGRVALLDAEKTELERALGDLTETVFSERLTAPGAIRSKLGQSATGPALHPSKSAFELFVEVANVIGDLQGEQIAVEARVISVDMSRFLFRLEGVAPTAESVDALQTQLEAVECFRSLQRNDLSRSRDGDGFRYSLQGAIECAGDSAGPTSGSSRGGR